MLLQCREHMLHSRNTNALWEKHLLTPPHMQPTIRMKVRKIKCRRRGKMHLSPLDTNAALDKCMSGKWREQRQRENRRTPATVKTRERRVSERRGRNGRQGGVPGMEERGFIEAAGESSVIAL